MRSVIDFHSIANKSNVSSYRKQRCGHINVSKSRFLLIPSSGPQLVLRVWHARRHRWSALHSASSSNSASLDILVKHRLLGRGLICTYPDISILWREPDDGHGNMCLTIERFNCLRTLWPLFGGSNPGGIRHG